MNEIYLTRTGRTSYSIEFICRVYSNPEVSIRWSFEGGSPNSTKLSLDNIINEVRLKNEGRVINEVKFQVTSLLGLDKNANIEYLECEANNSQGLWDKKIVYGKLIRFSIEIFIACSQKRYCCFWFRFRFRFPA